MAKRPTRASTGDAVLRIGRAMSDALLSDEEAARSDMEAFFVGAAPSARKLVKQAYTYGLMSSDAAPSLRSLVDIVHRLVAECHAPTEVLLLAASGHSLAASSAQLLLVEKTLGRKYDGLAEQSVAYTSVSAQSYVEDQLNVWVNDAAAAAVQFEEAVVADWRAASRLKETVEQVDLRMFSPQPARLPGHSGQGAWWRVFGALLASAKAQEFCVVNALAARCIQEFNVAGVALRDG